VRSEKSESKKLKLSLRTSTIEDATVVYCRGRIVFRDEAEFLAATLLKAVPVTRQLVLELSGVESIDNFGLGELVRLWHAARFHNCWLSLAAPSAHVLEMLHLTRLDTVFDIHASLEDALLAARGTVA